MAQKHTINMKFFSRNRQRLNEAVPHQVFVLTAHASLQRRSDMAYQFEQEANFWWLTGIEAADWRLIIDGKKSWLVAPVLSDKHAIFDGSLSPGQAKRISGVDAVIGSEEAEDLIKKLSRKHETISTLGKDPYEKHYDFYQNPAQAILRRELKKTFKTVNDCRLELTRLRAIKQPEEIAAIKRAVDLTVKAFHEIKRTLTNYDHEYQVEAEFTYRFRKSGATGHAYEPIVASGGNACTLHYVKNQDRLEKDGLLLLDIGARVDGYAADITRTYQVGKATKRQQQVHGAVESAHKEIISLLKPGLSVTEYQEKVDEIMKQRLKDLGLLKKPEDYRKYFPHAISHGLGVDVHDALGRPTEFKEGMVLTVEPGIYIPEEGIGVRIEDDILITRDGHENLSAALPTSL
jgi:Xaa-Pro aminopeptidase